MTSSAAIVIVGAYLIGSVLFAVVMSRLFRLPDPHTYGSNNPGATNVYRTGKKLPAVLTLIGDAIKGWLPVFIAKFYAADFSWDERVICLVALAVFLGHLFPIFFKFAGGKGVATALGILVGINGWLGLSLLGIWLVVVIITRKSSLAALIAAVCAPILSLLLLNSLYYHLTILIIALLLIWRHKSNIQKLISGREDSIDNKIDITSR
jgi:glycerol-3-phosphate acyltransferase PlsY